MTSFSLAIDAFVRKAKAAPELVVRKVATEVLTGIVLKTPVGNPDLWKGKPPAGYVGGRARASWEIGLNRIDADANVTITDKDGRRTIARGMAKLANYKPDDTVWIASRLPYINALEYGHSRQAPAGMVRVTLTQWNDFLNQAVRELPK